MLDLCKGWGEINDVVTGRNLLIKMMGMFATRTGINIYPSIYIENKVMDKLMKEKISADDLVPRFKDLE